MLRARVRIRFVKVAEYQARGVVHFHAVIRLDAAAEDYQPPEVPYTAALLRDAIGQAAAAVRIILDHHGQAVALGFGPQTDRRIMLGYGGHFLTKSRRYSVTFGQLRAARADHRRAARPPDPGRDAWGRPLDETVVLVLGTTWTYAGIDLNPTTPGAELAAASAARAREQYDQTHPAA
jgi:hypothetical protein